MKSVIIFFVVYLTYCYCEPLLGGWSISDDDNLKSDCLNRALVHLNGAQINNEIRSQASDLICHTQIVNGLNIKCTFNFNGQKWKCSYYKSFVQTLETQLEQCKQVENHPVVTATPAVVAEQQSGEQNDEEDLETANENPKQERLMASEDDEENKQQAAPINEDEEDKQSDAAANEEEKEKQVAGESLMANENNEEQDDDEAKIDSLRSKMDQQNRNNEVEQ